MIYKISPGRGDKLLYFAAPEPEEGKEPKYKMISRKDIPEHILLDLEPQKPVSSVAPENRRCLFCGQFATEQRWCNRELVNLCPTCYGEKTLGEIAEKRQQSVANPPQTTDNQ